jgi:hypothetical protein
MSTSTPSHHSLSNSKRSSAATSPARRPLQERSESDTNERIPIAAPTIRVVADNGPSAYSKSPFPTDPAHFLPPRPADCAVFERAVSDENAPSISAAAPVSSPPLELLPPPLEPRFALGIRPGSRVSTSTAGTSASRVSDADTLPVNASLSPSLSSRFSITTTSPSTPTLTSLTVNDEDYFVSTAKLSPALVDPSSNNASQSTIRLIVPSNYPSSLSANLALSSHPTSASRACDTPSASFTSSSALIARKDRRRSSPLESLDYPASLQSGTAWDRPNLGSTSSENLQSPPAKSKQAQPWTVVTSTDSLDSDASYPPILLQRQRSASSPPSTSHASSRGTIESAHVQFPQVRSASATGSWAAVSAQPVPQARMNDSANRLSIWSSRLSTIPSESEPGSRSNHSSGPPSDQAQRSPRLRRVIGSIASEATASRSDPSDSSLPMRPPPLFSGAAVAPRDLPPVPLMPARDSEEGEDTVGELQAPVLRPQRSGYLARFQRALSRPGSSESLQSQMSFQGELSWVR